VAITATEFKDTQQRSEIEEEQWLSLMSKDYHHPYTPYDVQNEFMAMVYKCLEEGKVGIFESPTGTVSHCISYSCFTCTFDSRRRWTKDAGTPRASH